MVENSAKDDHELFYYDDAQHTSVSSLDETPFDSSRWQLLKIEEDIQFPKMNIMQLLNRFWTSSLDHLWILSQLSYEKVLYIKSFV